MSFRDPIQGVAKQDEATDPAFREAMNALDQFGRKVEFADDVEVLGGFPQGEGQIGVVQEKYPFLAAMFFIHGRHFPGEDKEAEVGRQHVQQNL